MAMQLNLSSSNNFQIIFPKLPSENEVNRKLVLYAFDTILPGVSFNEDIVPWQGLEAKTIKGNLKYETWNVSFVVDGEFDNWKRLYNWMAYINNNINISRKKWEFSAINTMLQVFDNYNKKVLEVDFNKILPLSLGQIQFSFRNGETNLTSEISLIYDYFKIK